jgi:hypothetical protein
MHEDAIRALETLSRSGRPSTALARVQRYLGDEGIARETFRAAAERLGERAAALVTRAGLPRAARACLQAAEAWLEAGEHEIALRLVGDVLPHAGALPPDEAARLGFVLARAGDGEAARAVAMQVPASPARRALAAALDGKELADALRELEAAIRARGPEEAKPWADSAWWDVIRWLTSAGD